MCVTVKTPHGALEVLVGNNIMVVPYAVSFGVVASHYFRGDDGAGILHESDALKEAAGVGNYHAGIKSKHLAGVVYKLYLPPDSHSQSPRYSVCVTILVQ